MWRLSALLHNETTGSDRDTCCSAEAAGVAHLLGDQTALQVFLTSLTPTLGFTEKNLQQRILGTDVALHVLFYSSGPGVLVFFSSFLLSFLPSILPSFHPFFLLLLSCCRGSSFPSRGVKTSGFASWRCDITVEHLSQ